MTFSEYLKILHSYVGVNVDNQDYIVYLLPLIMRLPSGEEEEALEEQGLYYPYSGDASDRDMLLKIYNGSKELPKKKARMVKKYIELDGLKDEFLSIDINARNRLISELNPFGINCSAPELPEVCAELMGMFIDAASIGEKEIDASLAVIRDAALVAVYDDSQLKEKHGVHLLAETGNRCPYDGCYKSLHIETAGRSAFLYHAVQINPKQPRDNRDNLIALCQDCSNQYRFDLTIEKIERLEDIKLQISSLYEARETFSRERVVEGVEKVIRKISNIPLDRVAELNYKPTEVVKKMDKTDPSLFLKIHGLVSGYYPDVKELFQQIEMEGQLDFEKFCYQIKFKYKELADQAGLSQAQIFKVLVDWLASETNEEETWCEVVISYFVQKCEVFDAISE